MSGLPDPDEHDRLFDLISELVIRHSPSGVEGEIDHFLAERFESLGLSVHLDDCGNLIARIAGQGGGRLAITAHKDEIGAIVTELEDDGRLRVRKLGGSYPWVYGEGVVDILGAQVCVSGILSFGSRHVSHASPQEAHKEKAALRWADAWIETGLSAGELRDAGVRVGTRVVVGRHRKRPFRLGDRIASYALDNKASLAILLALAQRLDRPKPDVYLVASSKEEVGAIGGLYFAQRQEVDAFIALEVAPIAPEYPIKDGTAPVLIAEDAFAIYDDGLIAALRAAADDRGIDIQVAAVSGFGSDASLALKAGHVARAACLGFPTQNTHGYEITHLSGIANCAELLAAFCRRDLSDAPRP